MINHNSLDIWLLSCPQHNGILSTVPREASPPSLVIYHRTCEIKLCLQAFETVEKGQLFWGRTLVSSPFLSLGLLAALTAEHVLDNRKWCIYSHAAA